MKRVVQLSWWSLRRFGAWSLTAVAFGAALGGCGNKSKGLTQPTLAPPPQVVATVPAARASDVPYDSEIYVDFGQDMSGYHFSPENVFLKKDTERVPIELALENDSRRLRILPQVPLGLRRTYTVEFAGIKATTPSTLSPNWYFQFTTNSLRRPATPRPAPGTRDESPFVTLSWDSTEISAGTIRYELWTGADSNAVAGRIGTPLAVPTQGRWMPTAAWPLGGPVYWAVTVVNATTGERLAGPTRRFDVVDAATPVDSLVIPADDSGYNTILTAVDRVNPYQTCFGDTIVCAPAYGCWVSFPLATLPADVRVARARIEVATLDQYVARLQTLPITMWSSIRTWIHPCKPGLNFVDQLPSPDQSMAVGTPIGGRWVRFESPLLASHLEASVRRGGFYGYLFTVPTLRYSFVPARNNDPYRPVLKIHYFRTSSAPSAALAP